MPALYMCTMSGPWEAPKPHLPKTLGEQPSPAQHLFVIRGVATVRLQSSVPHFLGAPQ